ncbi:MAG TPA: CDP-diacylglycerol--glycerol-3-phosphate 3-phosphatidyltransferase [Candidatus Limnocylindria bacterium]|jgi:CDP-diacylglycerol--glycerol-3-phosphate 3-phosphatidyltransferase|nr:CDP-diacylglycerol--glycerol-3-phosphate 3-phosphatidyltransferase [Candidatus Limnocylindria bacterium]
MTGPRSPSRLTTLPNMLGLARIAATPIVVALLLMPFPGAGLPAFAVYAAAATTDYLDGRIARARDQVSALGVFLDLTADKVLVAGVLIAMVEVDLLPSWIVATLLIRELVVQGVRQVAASASVVIAARGVGKWKAFATNVAIGVLLLAFDAETGGPVGELVEAGTIHLIGFWLALLATALAVFSGVVYLRGAVPILLGRQS